MKRFVFARLAALFGLVAALLGTSTAPAAAAPGDRITPVTVVNSATGGHLLPNGWGGDHSDNIYMWAYNGYKGGDQWTFEERPSGYFLIRNNSTHKCLKPGLMYGGKTYVTQGNCDGSFQFQWWLKRSPYTGDYKIINRSTRQAMSPYYNKPSQVVVLDDNSNAAKNWWSLTGI